MCLCGFLWQAFPGHPLVLVFNRDEFFERPTDAFSPFPGRPHIFGGRDALRGGTWLGVNAATGRVAWVTNVRETPENWPAEARSRGALLMDCLESPLDGAAFLAGVDGSLYAGFNLVVADVGVPAGVAGRAAGMVHGSNREIRAVPLDDEAHAIALSAMDADRGPDPVLVSSMRSVPVPVSRVVPHAIAPGPHALSNATMDVAWPKCHRVHTVFERAMAEAIRKRQSEDAERQTSGPDADSARASAPASVPAFAYTSVSASAVPPSPSSSSLFASMADSTPLEEGHDVGFMSADALTALSAPFVAPTRITPSSGRYGTRSQTYLAIRDDGTVTARERAWDIDAERWHETECIFRIGAKGSNAEGAAASARPAGASLSGLPSAAADARASPYLVSWRQEEIPAPAGWSWDEVKESVRRAGEAASGALEAGPPTAAEEEVSKTVDDDEEEEEEETEPRAVGVEVPLRAEAASASGKAEGVSVACGKM